MSTRSSRTNEDRISPHQRRQAIVLLLAAGLARMIGGETPPEDSPESCRNTLPLPAETRLSVPTG